MHVSFRGSVGADGKLTQGELLIFASTTVNKLSSRAVFEGF
jgi:hypothetical protein